MAALIFELSTTPGTISAEVNYYEKAGGADYDPQPVPIPAPPANQNPMQIHDDQPWCVQLENLVQTGAIFGAFGGNTWEFKVIFEELGQGEGPASVIHNFAVNTTTPTFTYPVQVINFAAGALPVGEYKVYTTLKMVDESIDPITGVQKKLTPIAGAGEITGSGRLLQIINA